LVLELSNLPALTFVLTYSSFAAPLAQTTIFLCWSRGLLWGDKVVAFYDLLVLDRLSRWHMPHPETVRPLVLTDWLLNGVLSDSCSIARVSSRDMLFAARLLRLEIGLLLGVG
jgi:hypothetical protein